MTAGFVLDKDMRQACSTAGVATTKGKATELASLIRFVQQQIGEADAARDRAALINKLVLVSKAVKATADAFIDMAAVVTGNGGKAVQEAYGTASDIGSGLSKMANGQNGAADLTKGAIGYVTGKNSPDQATLIEECLGDFAKNTTNTFIDALNNDKDGVLKNVRTMTATCTAAGTEGAVRQMLGNTPAGNRIGKSLGDGVKIANTLYTYDQELGRAIDEWAEDENTTAMFDEHKRNAVAQMRGLEQKLAQLNDQLAACASELQRQA